MICKKIIWLKNSEEYKNPSPSPHMFLLNMNDVLKDKCLWEKTWNGIGAKNTW